MNHDLLIAVLGGGNIFLFVKFLIERHDLKKEREDKDELAKIKDELALIKKDGIRTQLLFMILLRPEEKTEILTLGETYFKKLKGNWYMTSVFNKWLIQNTVAKPEWFTSE